MLEVEVVMATGWLATAGIDWHSVLPTSTIQKVLPFWPLLPDCNNQYLRSISIMTQISQGFEEEK